MNKSILSSLFSTRNVCHLLNDKRSGLLPGLLLLALAATAAEPVKTPDACCQEKSAPKLDACCAAMAGTPASAQAAEGTPSFAKASEGMPFSRTSLYQLDATFTTDAGRSFSLGELRGRPVVLTMFFASCGYACPLIVADLQAVRAKLPADVRAQAVFVLVSFDVARDTPAALAEYRTQRGLDGDWVLLHGTDDAVRELAALLGVKYKQEADGAFSHSNVFTILNRQGEIVHQRMGLTGGLDAATAALAAAAR